MSKDTIQKRTVAIVLALLLLCALALATVWFFGPKDTGEKMEPNITVGPMENISEEELSKRLAERVDAGMIAFSINTNVVMDSPAGKANVKFENPGNNAKLTKLEVVRDDNGKTIYTSGLLEPGTYVDSAPLDETLDPGSYSCTAYISSYEQGTKKYLGKAAAALTISIKDGQSTSDQ